MVENILIAVTVSGIVVLLVLCWKLSNKWKEWLLEKIYGEKSTNSLDGDNLIRFVMVIIVLTSIFVPIIYFISFIGTTTSTNKEHNDIIRTNISYKEFLINQNIDIDIEIPNKFESLSADNRYTNHYFNFSTVLPDGFQVDRGNFRHTIIRCFKETPGITMSIEVTPLIGDLNQKQIQRMHES